MNSQHHLLAKAIITLANKKLSDNEGQRPALFNQIYRMWQNEETGVFSVSLQDHDGNVTETVTVTELEIEKSMLIADISAYLSAEDFPAEHLQALLTITRLFNFSEAAEAEVFEFARHLKEENS